MSTEDLPHRISLACRGRFSYGCFEIWVESRSNAHERKSAVMTMWEALPNGVTWTSSRLLTFEMSRADLEATLGPPQLLDLDTNGVGPADAWAMRFPCGLEVTLLIYKMQPDGSIATDPAIVYFLDIHSNEPNEEHVLFHIPLENPRIWRPDQEESVVSRRRWHLRRQDDNGHQFEVRAFTSLCEAESAARTFEARGHKQTYWVERDESHDGAVDGEDSIV